MLIRHDTASKVVMQSKVAKGNSIKKNLEKSKTNH